MSIELDISVPSKRNGEEGGVRGGGQEELQYDPPFSFLKEGVKKRVAKEKSSPELQRTRDGLLFLWLRNL